MPQDGDKTGREILPIPDQPHRGPVPFDARDASAPQQPMLRAPNGAPNGVIVLIDDMGLRHRERLWQLCRHAHHGRLAKAGLRYPRTEQFLERT
jgi:hypothetical protein